MTPQPRGETRNTTDPRGQFGAFLRAWRDKKGLTDAQLAEKFGLQPRAVRLWMKGDTGPAFGDLNNVADVMGYSDWSALAAACVRWCRENGI